MKGPIKLLSFLVIFIALVIITEIHRVEGVGECGKSTTPDNEAIKLAPCVTAAQNGNASVSRSCCVKIKQFSTNPKCLCAVLLSKTAKLSGVNPKIAITIPKRCNFKNRPIGYKCGPYTLP
ncbi:hypothetical protein TanjilG_14456 [Lupinus angustifolius]|uniref:Bifunctional inhibitor/plant lipid transfer protein/seed storage helical domain-containing protein n=1 Tax=Lupinus angustifolius TaxID=3871 RepID=A0A1J7H441_LUPAN|nr:PREDICTED: uncharacterized protein LOC109353001 [Lupinus angustifolius]OIW07510.1 hypothetical protein TanjilG_14456 [Lupinus angustifolius]